MASKYGSEGLTRREMLRLSATGATAIGTKLAVAPIAWAAEPHEQSASRTHANAANGLCERLLQTWCDALLEHQMQPSQGRALAGGLLCPSCVLVHGRCGDAIYPMLRMAHSSGDSKYLHSALLLYEWSEQQVSRADGSWINDVTLSSWQGITVFRAIALAEALDHHGSLLDTPTRERWTQRLAAAVKFLDSFISIETGNINYPITSSYCFAVCGKVLGEPRHLERARKMAHISMDYFTENNLLFGEGHPLRELSPKGCHPVDLGYNVEESLPALAMYALLAEDKPVLDKVVASLRAHMEFMLPDGGWDNSWGTRNYKWTWWGSRTSDGCHPGYALLAKYDPRFAEVARRNVELMSECTHDGLLYGGPDYFAHGDFPCIHHTFTHAKSLATLLDRDAAEFESMQRASLPRDEAYGLKSFPEIGTRLAAVGDWRATVTEYDWAYVEHVQSGGGSAGGGHASGGALSVLYHRALGPVLVASMTQYAMIELSNQQGFRDAAHMTLTPRIECVLEQVYTSLSDFKAVVTANGSREQVDFEAQGQLLNAVQQPVPAHGVKYRLGYRLTSGKVEITATATSENAPAAPLRLVLPVISHSGEAVDHDPGAKTIEVSKPKGSLVVRTDAPQGFDELPSVRTFNLVPGFECVPIAIQLRPGHEVRVEFSGRLAT